MRKKIIALLLCVCLAAGIMPEIQSADASGTGVAYCTHVQTYGWQDWVSDGTMSGTTGKAKRLEAVKIKLTNQSVTGDIEYRTHIQTYGWENTWKKNGAISGTSGQAKRLEAIEIRLTGEMAKKYDVYYRVHAQTYGWLGWAKNGEPAGTAGYAKRLEGIEIVLVKKGGEAPGSTSNVYIEKLADVLYCTHVQTYGWQDWVSDGIMSGTTGEAKRLEAVKIKLTNQSVTGDIEYRTHIQTYGWENTWKKNGAISGTSGQAKRLEAIEIRLTGEMAKKYDVYYRVHAQTYGWLGWAKNGEPAGTEGLSKRIESIQVVLVKKGADTSAYDNSGDAYKSKNINDITLDVEQSSNINVSKTGDIITIRCSKAEYVFKKIVNDTIHVDTWRLYSGSISDDNGNLYNMWSNTDTEGVVKYWEKMILLAVIMGMKL